VLAGFVLAQSSAGLADATIRGDAGHREQVRAWWADRCGRGNPPMPASISARVVRHWAKGTRLARVQALTTYFGLPSSHLGATSDACRTTCWTDIQTVAISDVARAPPAHLRRGRFDRWPATGRALSGRTAAMKWNLRLTAAHREEMTSPSSEARCPAKKRRDRGNRAQVLP
jgi:hypothetical protein